MGKQRTLDGNSLGERIAEMRAAAGMSLEDVARASGTTKSHVWELEQGRSRNPSLAMLSGLCRAFGCSIGEFIDTDAPIRPAEFAVCMGSDAMRISLGMRPRTGTPEDVVKWLRLRIKDLPAKQPTRKRAEP